jgi:two-component system LytT family response regulator
VPALRTLIVDDESLARRGLKLRLLEHPGVDIIGECNNGVQALAQVAELEPDLLLLDIQMPGMDGFDVVRELQGDTMPLVIFVTAFDQYAIDAFEVSAVDYVLKPIDDERLREAVDRAISRHKQNNLGEQKQNLMKVIMDITGADATRVNDLASGDLKSWPETLTIRDGDESHRVTVSDIDWIDAAGDYMCVHVGDVTHIMRITMKQLEALLNPQQFLRIHRSTIVNSQRIENIKHLSNGEYLLSLGSSAQLKVSRGYRDQVRNLAQQSAS